MTVHQKNRFGFPVEVEDLFDHLFGNQVPEKGWQPRTSIVESDSDYEVVVELPGMSATDVSVEMKEGRLDISGTKHPVASTEQKKLLRNEFEHGEFRRAFEFPTQVDSDKISAAFQNGLLTVTLPKSEKVLPRKIEIKSGS